MSVMTRIMKGVTTVDRTMIDSTDIQRGIDPIPEDISPLGYGVRVMKEVTPVVGIMEVPGTPGGSLAEIESLGEFHISSPFVSVILDVLQNISHSLLSYFSLFICYNFFYHSGDTEETLGEI